jgi:hypothetical protein
MMSAVVKHHHLAPRAEATAGRRIAGPVTSSRWTPARAARGRRAAERFVGPEQGAVDVESQQAIGGLITARPTPRPVRCIALLILSATLPRATQPITV